MRVDRSRLPALGPDPSFTFPEIERRTLANSLRVWTVEHRAVPLVSFLLLMPVGASFDPAVQAGLASLTGDMLDEGCGDLSTLDVHDALGRMGGHLETEVGADATVLTLTSLSRSASRGAALLADMAIRPRLEQRDFDRVRELRLNRLVQLRDMPPALAERAFVRLLYPNHPYGHMAIGTEESLRGLSLPDVAAFHRGAYTPAAATVVAAGDAPHEELADIVERAFGGWQPPADPLPRGDAAVQARPVPRSDRLALLHRPGAAQSELRIGHVAVPRSSPDYHTLLVLNMIIGGQFVSRINMNLRERRGYTYGARTAFDFRRGPGPFMMQASVQSDVTVDAVLEAISELQAIRGERPVTRAELETGRAALTRGYPRNFETAEQISRSAAQIALYDLPDDYFTSFVGKVLALTEADVTRIAAEHIDPGRLITVIVGDREKVGPSVERLQLGPALELSE
ncbi:MAG: insulinase family protein [Acidobacteria bacterium]|nr:insulinase family protein [Acidobacteriota bacterium]